MNIEGLKQVVDNQERHDRKVMFAKNSEYASDHDALRNFKDSAAINKTTPEIALWGVATKHLVKLIDMVHSGEDYPIEEWDSSIVDFRNYLVLLKAIVAEKALVDATFDFNEVAYSNDELKTGAEA